jgi:hypothetical protein
MKKLLNAVVAMAITLSLVSCGATTSSSSKENSSIAEKETLTGKWVSYSYADDGVGWFVLIKPTADNFYTGTFYTAGQSSGVFKDAVIKLEDLGEGMAEVTWPDGTVNTATWGKRTADTPSDMDRNWNSDIWFDCQGLIDVGVSRADCDFTLAVE